MGFIHTLLYYSIKNHRFTTSSITLQGVSNFNCQDFNHYPFSTYKYIYIYISFLFIWCSNPQWARASSFTKFLDLTSVYITCIILTEIIIIYNCYGVMVTQLTIFVPLYCCNNNITLKMAIIAAGTYW